MGVRLSRRRLPLRKGMPDDYCGEGAWVGRVSCGIDDASWVYSGPPPAAKGGEEGEQSEAPPAQRSPGQGAAAGLACCFDPLGCFCFDGRHKQLRSPRGGGEGWVRAQRGRAGAAARRRGAAAALLGSPRPALFFPPPLLPLLLLLTPSSCVSSASPSSQWAKPRSAAGPHQGFLLHGREHHAAGGDAKWNPNLGGGGGGRREGP